MTEQTANNEVAFGNLYQALILDNIERGLNRLDVLSGFASGALVRQLLFDHENIRINLIIGMAGALGIPAPDHQIYTSIARSNPRRFQAYYYPEVPGVHAKAYVWFRDDQFAKAFITSANFSQSGMHYLLEASVSSSPREVHTIIDQVRRSSVSVLDPRTTQQVRIIPAEYRFAQRIRAAHGTAPTPEAAAVERATLSLLPSRGMGMHLKSGLNWGQRGSREPNQAYIPVPVSFYEEHPCFLPPRGRRFTIQTDDGETFVCVVAQDGNKAIETPENNSELGVYFRRRLGIPLGEFVAREAVEHYGRTSVELTKVDEDLFLMDFSR